MKITEAMAEIKLCIRKIETNLEFVQRNLIREDWRRDPFEKDGTTQEAQVKAALQSITDLQERIVELKFKINVSNMSQQLEVGGVSRTVAEWLIWRQNVLPLEQRALKMLATLMANMAIQQPMGKRTFAGAPTSEQPTNFIINVSDKWLHTRIQKLEEIEQRLDGQLSILNANTEI